MPRVIYRLTETFTYQPRITMLPRAGSTAVIFPGLVDGKYIRDAMGPETFKRAIALGVLVREGRPA